MAEGVPRKYDINPGLCQRGLNAIGTLILGGTRPLTLLATPVEGGYTLRKPIGSEVPNAARRTIEFMASCLDLESTTADVTLVDALIGKQGLVTLTYPDGLPDLTELPAKRVVVFGSTTVTDYTHVHQGERGFMPLDTPPWFDNATLDDFIGGLEAARLI